MKAAPPLEDALKQRYFALLEIKRRLFVLQAFVDELERVSRSKEFRIRNDIVWNMLLDYRDKCIIDLYSHSVEMRHGVKPEPRNPKVKGNAGQMNKCGLFALIRDHYTTSLQRVHPASVDDDSDEVALHAQPTGSAFEALFPHCTTDSPAPSEIEDLCERFRLRMKPLGVDRNKNRAHAYEGDAGKARMLPVGELHDIFGYCEDVLEQLSEVSASVSFSWPNMNTASTPDTASDLVDLVLLGNTDDVTRVFQTHGREGAYARMHEIHDRDPAPHKDYFNQRHLDAEFVDEPAR